MLYAAHISVAHLIAQPWLPALPVVPVPPALRLIHS
jgi:hypothetical protein